MNNAQVKKHTQTNAVCAHRGKDTRVLRSAQRMRMLILYAQLLILNLIRNLHFRQRACSRLNVLIHKASM